MSSTGHNERHRVFVRQALGADEFLRVTWHESRALMVFSHWEGDRCVAATPVRVADIEELAALTQQAHHAAGDLHPAWPAPHPDTLVVPAAGLRVPQLRTA
ncbi:MAG: hypothetical protein WBP59_11175 [Ilumatobacteraceae bacterium]